MVYLLVYLLAIISIQNQVLAFVVVVAALGVVVVMGLLTLMQL
jgi:hypothetical protein